MALLFLNFLSSCLAPGAIHVVLTTEDSLIAGGHFFNLETFALTLNAVVLEHFAGLAVTNANHDDACIIAFKLLWYCLTVLRGENEGDCSGPSE